MARTIRTPVPDETVYLSDDEDDLKWEQRNMMLEDKYDQEPRVQFVLNKMCNMYNKPFVLNKMWNAVADAKIHWEKHGMNHTEEQYRVIANDFGDRMKRKNEELKLLNREKVVSDNCLKRVVDENRALKKVADKCKRFEDEYGKIAKKLRTIEDYIANEDCRTVCSVEEFMTTDPALKMFFQIE